jgi:drug/metabolite transporter (DMT)-like permease
VRLERNEHSKIPRTSRERKAPVGGRTRHFFWHPDLTLYYPRCPSPTDICYKYYSITSSKHFYIIVNKPRAMAEMRVRQSQAEDEECQSPQKNEPMFKPKSPMASAATSTVSSMGLRVLCLLAFQNCSKNLLVRYVMKDQPKFLTSAAVVGSEATKLSMSIFYILFFEKKSIQSIVDFLRKDWHTTMLVIVPASAYNLQMTLEYVAMANLDASMFSVLVQTKLVFTAGFAFAVLRKKLKRIQCISLVLLTSGVMLCNLSRMSSFGKDEQDSWMDAKMIKGISATLGIALSSGFASVYTEKVIKGTNKPSSESAAPPSLAYTQVQLAAMSLVAIGAYAMIMDFRPIVGTLFFCSSGIAHLLEYVQCC